MRVEILGQERRRRWGDAKKLDVVMWSQHTIVQSA